MLKLYYKTTKTKKHKKGNNKKMETELNTVEAVTKSELLELATWDRPRSIDQLRSFVSRREAEIANFVE